MMSEDLLPIRIEIEDNHQRLRETFVWNVNGTYALTLGDQFTHPSGLDMSVTPELFAQTTCDDLELPSSFVSKFIAQVKEQLAEYVTHKQDFPTPVPAIQPLIQGRLDGEDEVWWAGWRKRLRVDEKGGYLGINGDSLEEDGTTAVEEREEKLKEMTPPVASSPAPAPAPIPKPPVPAGPKPPLSALIIPKPEDNGGDTALSSPLSEPSPAEGGPMEVDSSSDEEEEEEEEDDGWPDHELRIIIKVRETIYEFFAYGI